MITAGEDGCQRVTDCQTSSMMFTVLRVQIVRRDIEGRRHVKPRRSL